MFDSVPGPPSPLDASRTPPRVPRHCQMSPGEENQACLTATAGHAPAVCCAVDSGPRTLLWLTLCLTRGRPGQSCPEERAQEDGGPLVPPRACGQRRGAKERSCRPKQGCCHTAHFQGCFSLGAQTPFSQGYQEGAFSGHKQTLLDKLCWSALMARLLEKQNLLSAHLFLFGSLLNFPMETPPCPMEEGRQV